MKRDLTPEEQRDHAILMRTEKHFTERLALLCMGDQQLVASVEESLSHKFCDAEVMARLIVLAVTDKHQAGAVLESLIHGVMRDAAEVEAVKEVEQIEKQRAQEADEDRVSVAMYE
jgi:hypothetical protein